MPQTTPKSEAKEEILSNLPTINHITKPKTASKGKNTATTPTQVATPLPPSNFKKGEKQCPTTAKNAIIHCAS